MRAARSLSRILMFSLLLALFPAALLAQITSGTPPLGSFAGGPDVINLATINSEITASVIHRAGRGLPFNVDIAYNSAIWYPAGSSSIKNWQPFSDWGLALATPIGYVTYSVRNTVCSGTHVNLDIYSNWTYVDSNGTSHPFNISTWAHTSTPCTTTSETATATDGSGYTMKVTGASVNYVLSPDGATIHPIDFTTPLGPGSIQDRNGNQLSVDSNGNYTDTLGGVALSVSGAAPNPTTYTYTAPGANGTGVAAAVTVTYQTYTVKTNFGCTNVKEYPATNIPLVDKITLADGTFYQFAYEPTPGFSGDYTGRIASVTLPTGGSISYQYSRGGTGVNGITCTDGSPATVARTTPDGTWTYNHTKSGTAGTTTVTDPYDNQTVYQFEGIYETQRQVYQGTSSSGTLLETVITCYNGNTSNCTSTSVTLPISQRTITMQFGSGNLQSQHVEFYNATYGLITEIDDYDFGAGAPGPLLRKVLTTNAPLGNGIVDRVASTTVQDGGGHTVAQTTYTYDQGTVASTSGTPQLVSVSGSRGNATTVSYLVQGTTSLTKGYSYFDTGNVQTVTDVNGATTTYNYSNATSTCGNAFPTSVTEPLSLSKSMAYNCIGAVQTSLTDENGQLTSTAYTDPYFWRPASVTDPASAVTNFCYGILSGGTCTLNSSQRESTLSFNGGSSALDPLVTRDGLGRPHVSQVREAPGSSNFDSTETDYDSSGRVSRVTLPYVGTVGQTNSSAPAKTTTYDALNRILTISDNSGGSRTFSYTQNDVYITRGPAPSGENTKRRQEEFDALGRLTSVCEITSASGSGTCAQNTSQKGYWTKYTHDALGRLTGVTQNAQGTGQTRTYVYDLIGRLTSETNPENGTTTYVYDTDATCGTATGDRVKKTDAIGNVTCTAYDAPHRPTATTYPSGSYASVTPAKHFVYDSATVNSVAMTNVKGRLAEAYTCTGACSSKITDEGFSYTNRGEASDFYQSTPNSGGYFHSVAAYWPNGVMQQLNGYLGTTSNYFASWNPDGEGRVTSAQGWLSSTSYNAASQPTQLNLGSGDTDSFTYDPNTGRMTQYKYTVNNQSVVGNLTWNANGTLGQLAITDPFNSADNQTCTYSHDDLVRIASVNCGASTWSQTFSYDSFGNISANGTMNYLPIYSSAANQISSIGSCNATYDANGNATNDCVSTYTWDADGHAVTIDGNAATYDALGRMVEANVIGIPSPQIYSPTGFLMQLPATQKKFVPLPGGEQVVYLPSAPGGYYYRHVDWLGSSRFGSTPSRTMLYDGAYAPFGTPYAFTGSGQEYVFTGQEHNFPNQYDFPAREFAIQGRWPSPDPAGLASVRLSDPQTWNRYAYVRGNPLAEVDPSGLAGMACKASCSGFYPPSGPPICTSLDSCFSSAQSWMPDVQSGYNIFDAIAGEPGTYISYNMYGQMGFGFSVDLYAATLDIIDSVRNGTMNANSMPGMPHDITDPGSYPWDGFQVYVHDSANFTTVSGVVPDYLQALAALAQINGYALQKLKGVTSPEQRASILNQIFSDPGVEGLIDSLANASQALWELILRNSPVMNNSNQVIEQ